MNQEKQSDDIFSQLVWLVESGADEAIDEHAGMLNWHVEKKVNIRTDQEIEKLLSVKPEKFKVKNNVSSSFIDTPPNKINSNSLSELKAEIQSFHGCGLRKTAMNFVFSDGNPESDIMIIGDAPSSQDDRQGKPFVGEHGVLLDKMLSSIGLNRDNVYLTNLVFWRPPGGRSLTQEEIDSCMPFCEKHIDLVKPKIIVCFDVVTAQNLLRCRDSFSKIRGKWLNYKPVLSDSETIRCITTYSPSYLLRLPTSKRQSWKDLLEIKQALTN